MRGRRTVAKLKSFNLQNKSNFLTGKMQAIILKPLNHQQLSIYADWQRHAALKLPDCLRSRSIRMPMDAGGAARCAFGSAPHVLRNRC